MSRFGTDRSSTLPFEHLTYRIAFNGPSDASAAFQYERPLRAPDPLGVYRGGRFTPTVSILVDLRQRSVISSFLPPCQEPKTLQETQCRQTLRTVSQHGVRRQPCPSSRLTTVITAIYSLLHRRRCYRLPICRRHVIQRPPPQPTEHYRRPARRGLPRHPGGDCPTHRGREHARGAVRLRLSRGVSLAKGHAGGGLREGRRGSGEVPCRAGAGCMWSYHREQVSCSSDSHIYLLQFRSRLTH